jgi:medium-chain acyl-[acyl-carrier-protein] hydrolase
MGRSMAAAGPANRRGAIGDPRLRLFCLPHGGAGASVFRNWQPNADHSVEVIPVQLSGREERAAEPLDRSIAAHSASLASQIIERAADVPYALLGHSMGGLIAYELCHLLADCPAPPVKLVVSGLGAPHLDRPNEMVSHLPDKEFIDYVMQLGGTPTQLAAQPELLALLLPILRADFEACERYRHLDRPPLRIPVLALGGSTDPLAPPSDVARWRELTTGGASVRIWPGGHFFLFEHLDEVVELMQRRMATR